MTEEAVARDDNDRLQKAVAEDLADAFKPVPFHRHTQINGKEARVSEIRPGEDPHSKWLRFGEQLHDQQVKTVAELDRRYQALQDEIVAKMRERDAVMIDRAIEHSRLASYRAKLGYGR